MPLQTSASVPDTSASAPGAAEAVSGASRSLWTQLVEAVASVTRLGTDLTEHLLQTAALFVVVWAVRLLVLAAVRRRAPDNIRRLYQWRKGTTYVGSVVVVLALINIWVGTMGSLGTFLGLLSAGVAIALRDPLVNLAGWLFILGRRPFSQGDRIAIRGHTGDVIDQRLFQFTLLEVGTSTGAGQSTGRIVHVPNGWVFSDSVVNHTGAFAYVWHEVAVVVTFESDWRAAKQIVLDVAHECADHLSADAERAIRRAAREYFIFYSKLTPTVYTSVVGEGVQLTMRYLVAPRRVRGSAQDVWEAILDRFAARDDIDLAYPTTRFYRNNEEGKPGAGGPPRLAASGDGDPAMRPEAEPPLR
ncbi:MAG: mechanosensitive ion channel family protein [Bacteroidota bacterium]